MNTGTIFSGGVIQKLEGIVSSPPHPTLTLNQHILSITDDIEKRVHALEKTHMPNFLSYKLGTETITPNTSATNEFPQLYSGRPIDSY
jgi:hypothetical protein